MHRGNRNHNQDNDFEYNNGRYVRRMKTPSRIEMCVENAVVKSALGYVGAGLASFLLFRTRGARFTVAGFGAGMGAGVAWMDSKLAFSNPHLDVPSFQLLNLGYVKHQWNRLEDMLHQAYDYTANQMEGRGDFSKRVHQLETSLKEQAGVAKDKAQELKHRYWDEDETGYAEMIKDKALELKDQAVQTASDLKHRYWDENEDVQDMMHQAKGAAQRAKRDVESHGSQWKQRNFDNYENDNQARRYNNDQYHDYQEFNRNKGREMRDRAMGRGNQPQYRRAQDYGDDAHDHSDDTDQYVDRMKDKAMNMKDQAMGEAYEMKRKYVDSDYSDKAKDMAAEMKYKAKAAGSTMKQKVKDAATSIKEKADSTVSDAKQKVMDDDIVDQAKEKATSMKDQASSKTHAMKANSAESSSKV